MFFISCNKLSFDLFIILLLNVKKERKKVYGLFEELESVNYWTFFALFIAFSPITLIIIN